MFTLGNKEAIVNGPKHFPLTLTGTSLNILGYGSFEQSQIVSAIGNRYQEGTMSTLAITCPSASDLGLIASDTNIAVVANIYLTTSRHSSEWANDFIKKGKPYVFELILNGTTTAIEVATKLATMMTAYGTMFINSDRGLPFTFVDDAAGVLTLTAKDDFLNFRETVTFKAAKEDSEFIASTVRVVNVEATTSGKYLEENVSIGNGESNMTYGNRPGEVPYIESNYSSIQFVMKEDSDNGINGDMSWRRHKNLGISMVDASIGENTHTFTLYFNEEACLETGGQVDVLMTWLLGGTPVVSDFLVADGVTAATSVADFIA